MHTREGRKRLRVKVDTRLGASVKQNRIGSNQFGTFLPLTMEPRSGRATWRRTHRQRKAAAKRFISGPKNCWGRLLPFRYFSSAESSSRPKGFSRIAASPKLASAAANPVLLVSMTCRLGAVRRNRAANDSPVQAPGRLLSALLADAG